MNYNDIKPIADCLVARLREHCVRIEIAGSIRRQRPDCGDIELVVIPKTFNVGLFGDEKEVNPNFIKVVDSLLPGRGKADGKYCCRAIKFNGVEVNVDIFMTTPEQWGTTLAIRTGSADFAHYSLAKRWVKQGWRSKDNVLSNEQGEERTFSEEQELFDFLGLPWIKPEGREAFGLKDKEEYYVSKGADVPF